MAEACCTCATILSEVLPLYDEKTEKAVALDRRLDCCSRVICGPCSYKNPRFQTYCPFCQISTAPNPIPAQGLRDPPSYKTSKPAKGAQDPNTHLPIYSDDALPPYSSQKPLTPPPEKTETPSPAEDVLHFLDHRLDTLPGLALRYNVPVSALRSKNNLTSDHLLTARRTILIPGEFYKSGVSLSPRPVEGEEEEVRRSKIRKWMVACKVADYDVALLYLKQTEYDLNTAIEAYKDDEKWEKEHPLEGNVNGKGKKYDVGRRRFTGQRS